MTDVTCDHSNGFRVLELKEEGCVDQGPEGDVDYKHRPCAGYSIITPEIVLLPRPGGDLHLARAPAAGLAQFTDALPAHFMVFC